MTDGGPHSFNLFADYFQFYLQDDDRTAGVDGDAWTPEAMTARVANGDRFVAIGAARNLEVSVTVELTDRSPEVDAGASHVVEADLVVSTGRVVVAGRTDEFERAARIPIEVGRYRVRIGRLWDGLDQHTGSVNDAEYGSAGHLASAQIITSVTTIEPDFI